jgi:hypothetical protein
MDGMLSLNLRQENSESQNNACMGIACIDPHFLDLGTRWRWVFNFTPRPLYPRRKSSRYTLDRRLGEPQSWSRRFGEDKFLTLRGLELRPLGPPARIIFYFTIGGKVHTGSTRHRGYYWPIVPAPGDCEDGEFGGMNGFGRGNRNTRRKPAPTPLYPPQIPLARSGREPGPQRWKASD